MSTPADGPSSGSEIPQRPQAYRPRVVDQELRDRLRSRGAVVIEGPKACGRTATAMQRAASVVRLDADAGARRTAEIDAELVLNGPTPRLLDDGQTVPVLWNHVRRAVDDRALPGQFILTGSAIPAASRRSSERSLHTWPRQHPPPPSPATPEAPRGLDRDTAARYLDALDRLMITEDQPAWAPHLRSRSRARTAPKRHFVDPSLAAAALGATPPRLLRDIGTLGLLFESLVIRDLRVYAQSLEAAVLLYRDNTGLEVDAIVETSDGTWAAFEIKPDHDRLDEAAVNLLKFADRVDDRRTGPRARLVVITGTGYAYDRPDGVAVVPIGALGP